MSARGPKLLTRTRGVAAVVSRARLVRAVHEDRAERLIAVKKLRIVGRPHRRAGQQRKA